MTIEKSIELNRQAVESLKKGKFLDHAKAVELGIEALKRHQERRNIKQNWAWTPLPGETKE